MRELHYGKNVEWFLQELSAHEAGDIESAEIEVIGENDQGVEGSATIDITLLAADAVTMIAALQQKLDAANKELASYSMSAGRADQFAAEAKAVRKALGYAENAEDVAPVDLLEKISGLRADGVEMFAKHCDDSIGFIEPEDEDFYTLMEEQARTFAAQLRAETDTTPSQYESLAGGK